ncbi:MAG: hypothetical protein JSR86_09610 [Proteobacteria bacterium]|nr:hypothetical protein [Pseudomonadota bacterium]
MTAILYPVAPDAETALNAPLGRAGRERDAVGLAGGAAVRFVSEAVGPAFDTREAALDAHAGRVEDDRPGRQASLPAEDRFCQLREVVRGAEGRWPALTPLTPAFEDGRRWPAPSAQPRLPTAWRLSVSYWRVQTAREAAEQARLARKAAGGAERRGEDLRALAAEPLRPVRPQQPLDIGLFEVRPPEAPDTLIPDE